MSGIVAGAARVLARKRVAGGFLAAAVMLVLARPTWESWRAGLLVAAVGECIRLWAAGHLEKGREVTRSGPYRFLQHPLYAGSTLMGTGFAVASASWVVAAVVAAYLVTTLVVAIRTEEAYLRATFGDTYDRYAAGTAPEVHRAFSVDRALRNKEYRSVLGFVAASLALLAYAWR